MLPGTTQAGVRDGHGQHRHGEDLMRQPGPERHHEQQGHDAKGHLG
jgi:hypothetical protein